MRVWMRFFWCFFVYHFLHRNYEMSGSFHLGALPRASFLLTRGGGVRELLLTRKRFLLSLILAPPLPPQSNSKRAVCPQWLRGWNDFDVQE